MYNFYVNTAAQTNGDHEVHQDGCRFMPTLLNRRHLGVFSSCYGAVQEARKIYSRANGCYFCALSCHTS
ncbi:hypothetical protein DMW99_27140 [Pseudomonas chlororaphis]|nr:hypothetical protein C1Y36_12700 [Pseudomonas sp. FW306-2-2C-D06C]PYC31105.1 hypothetical protein DMW99_27140 [Pseudomonas chlororaphis]